MDYDLAQAKQALGDAVSLYAHWREQVRNCGADRSHLTRLRQNIRRELANVRAICDQKNALLRDFREEHEGFDAGV
jgi:hypothetical protein